MRKPDFCQCENKGADQLCSNCKADQCLCFRYTDSPIPHLSKSKNFQSVATFCACTARFVSDVFGNHIVDFLIMRLIFLTPFVTSRIADNNHLSKSTYIFRGVRSSFDFFTSIFIEIPLSKQYSP